MLTPLFENEQKAFGNGLFYSINQSADKIETNINAKFIIHGFDLSWNGQVITEDVCAENKDTLLGQPILVKYYNEGDKTKDHLGDHEVYITQNRDTGQDMMATDTFAIGTFQQVAIEDVNLNGENKRCLVGYAQLWLDRYYNVCSLLNEWLSNGIQIVCSCEYVFKNYEMKNDIQYIKSPYSYTGHTILNSEEKDGYGVVLPAYDEAAMVSWNAALHKDEEKFSKNCEVKSVENAFLKSLNDISIGETRRGIYDALANVMTAIEYEYMWLSDWQIFDDYFVYETYDMDAGSWKYFKVNYSKTDDGIHVDYANKKEVKFEEVMVEVNQVQKAINEAKAELETKVTELSTKITEQETTISDKDTELNTLRQDNLTQKETVISLNGQIEELNSTITGLNEYKEKYEKEVYEQALTDAKEVYKAKFAKVGGAVKYESDEVQNLIAETLDSEKALNAKLALADMLVDMIDANPTRTSTNSKGIVEPANGLGSLKPDTKKKVVRDIDIYDFEN